MWSWERLTRKQLTSRQCHLWPELWKSMGKHAKLKEKQKWSNEKLHLENARKLRGIYFIDPEDKECKETIKIFEIRIFGAEKEILRRTPWSRIREQNSVYKEFLEIVGNGKPTGSVWKETIAVSATISISVEKLHHQIRLRILSCSKMSENHRGPEVPEVRVPAVECLDGLARITSKELAPIHFVKNGTLQNACSTRPRVVVGLGKSAHTHIVSGWWTAD